VGIANALQLEAARATPALYCFNYDAMPRLKSLTYPSPYYSVFRWYITLRCDLVLWPLTLNICSVSPMTWWNSVPNLNAIEQSAAELLQFHCLALWPYTLRSCCPRLWDNFHQFWPSTTYPCLNYSIFYADTLCHAVTLTSDLSTVNFYITSNVLCLNSVQNLREIK